MEIIGNLFKNLSDVVGFINQEAQSRTVWVMVNAFGPEEVSKIIKYITKIPNVKIWPYTMLIPTNSQFSFKIFKNKPDGVGEVANKDSMLYRREIFIGVISPKNILGHFLLFNDDTAGLGILVSQENNFFIIETAQELISMRQLTLLDSIEGEIKRLSQF